MHLAWLTLSRRLLGTASLTPAPLWLVSRWLTPWRQVSFSIRASQGPAMGPHDDGPSESVFDAASRLHSFHRRWRPDGQQAASGSANAVVTEGPYFDSSARNAAFYRGFHQALPAPRRRSDFCSRAARRIGYTSASTFSWHRPWATRARIGRLRFWPMRVRSMHPPAPMGPSTKDGHGCLSDSRHGRLLTSLPRPMGQVYQIPLKRVPGHDLLLLIGGGPTSLLPFRGHQAVVAAELPCCWGPGASNAPGTLSPLPLVPRTIAHLQPPSRTRSAQITALTARRRYD